MREYSVSDRSVGEYQTVPVHILYVPSSKFPHHVHAAGCQDVKRKRIYQSWELQWDVENEIEVSSLSEIVFDAYGPHAGSYFEEGGYTEEEGVKAYASDFKVFPCLNLPFDPIKAGE
jgi:hypothetical protein